MGRFKIPIPRRDPSRPLHRRRLVLSPLLFSALLSMQKSQGPTTARRRPLRLLPGNRTPHPPPPQGSRPRKPAPTPAAACRPATACPPASDAAAIDRLLLARSDLAGLVSQVGLPFSFPPRSKSLLPPSPPPPTPSWVESGFGRPLGLGMC